MSNMTEAEKDLSDKLDDMLVANRIEKPLPDLDIFRFCMRYHSNIF